MAFFLSLLLVGLIGAVIFHGARLVMGKYGIRPSNVFAVGKDLTEDTDDGTALGLRKRLSTVGLAGILLFLWGGLARGVCAIAVVQCRKSGEFEVVAPLVETCGEMALVVILLGAGITLVCSVRILWVKD